MFCFSVDSSALRFEVESDDSHADFSADDDNDKEYDGNSDISSHESIDQPEKEAAGKKKKNRTMSNQSLQQNLQDMRLNLSPIDFFREHDASIDADQQMQMYRENNDDRNQRLNSTENNDGLTPANREVTPNANANATRNTDDIVDQDIFNAEDDEFSIDRQLRLLQEQEEEERGANMNRSLLAPREEIRQRNRRPKKTNSEHIDLLREKQLKLVDLQINLNEVLLETAKITQNKERILLAQAVLNAGANVSTDNSAE